MVAIVVLPRTLQRREIQQASSQVAVLALPHPLALVQGSKPWPPNLKNLETCMKKFIWQPFVRPAMLLGLVLWACALPVQAGQDCDNQEAYAWAKKGYAAFQQGLYDHAYYNYQKSIALACTDYQSAFLEGYNTLALCHFKANDYSTAFKLYLEAGNYAQGKAKSTNYLDLAYTATFFDLPLAKQYFDSVQVKTPRYFSMYTVYLEQVQDYSTMAQLLAIAADTTRGYDGLLLRQNRAKAWLKTGKEAAAIQEWATLWNHSLADNSLKAFASLALGRAYEAQQDTARAMAWHGTKKRWL